MTEAIKRTDPSAEIIDRFLSRDGSNTLLPSFRVVKKALSFATTSNGSLLSWQNPENVAIMATVLVHVTTAGTGTAGVDIGTDTAGTGSSDNLLDVARVDTVGLVRGVGSADLGSNGHAFQLVAEKGGTSDYIVGKANDADATAAGDAYILYIPIS